MSPRKQRQATALSIRAERNRNGMIPVNVVRKGTWIKALLSASALSAFAQGAVAGESECRAIESTGGRLACYDAAFPPKAKKPATPATDASRAAYRDRLIAEDARTAAKLKNICRGC
jgi:hypothetical protein